MTGSSRGSGKPSAGSSPRRPKPLPSGPVPKAIGPAPRRALPPGPEGALPPTLRVRVVSGPSLDLLGQREPEVYGTATLAQIHAGLVAFADQRGVFVECLQSNNEGDLVTWIGRAANEGFDGIVLNAAAFTHTSIAILDAIRACDLPTVEVHLSNPEAREAFRHASIIAPACVGKVTGFGAASYMLGLLALVNHLRDGGELRTEA